MDLVYYKSQHGNFGDDMNEWFWDEAFPEHRQLAPKKQLLGIGSILSVDAMQGTTDLLVMGSGTGIGTPPEDDRRRTISYGFVRGPLTAQVLNLPKDRAIADPACLVPRLDSFADLRLEPGPRSGEILFMPHTGSVDLPIDWDEVAHEAGATLLSPRQDSRDVIRRIATADRIVTESMHGAIIADAFRVPWTFLAIAPNFNRFKIRDWGLALGIEPQIRRAFPVISTLMLALRDAKEAVSGRGQRRTEREIDDSFGRTGDMRKLAQSFPPVLAGAARGGIIRSLRKAIRGPAQLSDDAILRQRQDEMLARIDAVRRDLDRG